MKGSAAKTRKSKEKDEIIRKLDEIGRELSDFKLLFEQHQRKVRRALLLEERGEDE
jgi:hypothetical protein